MKPTRSSLRFAIALPLILMACDAKGPDPESEPLTLAQALAALPSPAQLGRSAEPASAGAAALATRPVAPGPETPALGFQAYVAILANGGMDDTCATFYGEMLHLLKSLSPEDYATGSHTFADVADLGGPDVSASWTESGGSFAILVSSSDATWRARLDIEQSARKVKASMVIKIIPYLSYYSAIYDEASGSCEIFLTGYSGSAPTPDDYSVYAKNQGSSAHTLIASVKRSGGNDTPVCAAYADESGSVIRYADGTAYCSDGAGTPFFGTGKVSSSWYDDYRVASMTTYPAGMAYDDAYGSAHPLFFDANGNGQWDSGESDVAGGITVKLYPLAAKAGGYISMDSKDSNCRPYVHVAQGASLPSGFVFDASLVALKAALDSELATYAEPYAAGLLSHSEAQARFVDLITREESSAF